MKYVTHNEKGQITQWAMCPESMFHLQSPPDGHFHVVGEADLDAHYVVDGAIVDRPLNPAVLTGNQLLELPIPCTIFINDKAYPCVDAVCDLSFARGGLLYKIRVEAFPYADAVFQVQT